MLSLNLMERHKKSKKISRIIKKEGKSAASGNFVPFTGSSNPRDLSAHYLKTNIQDDRNRILEAISNFYEEIDCK
jgi:hypothetical protein